MKNIWTNGCFDILHIGHIELFKFAKSLGDKLIVGLDSDNRIKTYKYPNSTNRPINKENDRFTILKSIKYIDDIVIFDSHEYMKEKIKEYNINTIIVGDDYKDKYVVGSELVSNVIFFPKIANYSSSNILDKII